ncbi:NRAMP family divalent metal transporter [Virgibacillus siamensis]|uniref:NRAMP family divalent metal transporter n=1 Tax=Virgibacillus siamensis TaxID=480071 RepID=UPI0009858AA4|nr:NRAMP family divalent metal transporter [Virgibacillus siamensis]
MSKHAYDESDLKPGKMTRKQKQVFWGAIFLMATSSIGPGFLTQTSYFTDRFAASFAFAILVSIIIDIGAQLNIWRVLVVSKKRGQDVANMVLPGLGTFIAILIVLGGLAFNIGNVGGAGLGVNILIGVSPKIGAIITAILAIIVFSLKNSAKIMDFVALTLGIIMLTMVAIVMVTSSPPVMDAAVNSVFPGDYGTMLLPAITLIGGTVGGYITFAGGHRLLDAGIHGKENAGFAGKAANWGVLTTGVMRVILFLAILGVVTAGYNLSDSHPTASVFQYALGGAGYKIFGVVLFSAALTSVIGAAYTSVTFMRSFHPAVEKYNNLFIIGFIVFSTLVFVLVGQPVKILVLVGSVNGLILPLTLGAILVASRKKKIVGDYQHPTWMIALGVLAVIVTVIAGYFSLQGIADIWTG